MDKLIIKGGKKLGGEVTVSGSKNASLPIFISTILAPGVHEISNVPFLRDINTTIKVLETLGAKVEGNGNVVRIDTTNVDNHEATYELVKTMRASVLVLGPLLARFGEARMSLPGGCAIGARPVDQHIKGLQAMGADITVEHGYIIAKAKRLKGARITTDMVTVNYRGTLIDGTEFDSSYKRNQPATFPVNGVIKGWTEALQLMKQGAKYQLFIPSTLAYGERAMGPDIGPNSTLIFDVELQDVKPPPTPAPQGSAAKIPPAPSPAPTKK